MTGPEDFQVSGGAGGTSAHYQDLGLLGRGSEDLAGTLARISAQCQRMLADPDVAASAVLDPAGAAAFERELAAAVDGPAGLTALAGAFTARAAQLRLVSAGYRATDEANRVLIQQVTLAGEGLRAGTALTDPGTLPMLASYVHDGGFDYQRFITDHPGVVDGIVDGAADLTMAQTLGGVHDVPGAAALLGRLLYPGDGTGTVTDLGVDPSKAAGTPPASLSDLLASLDHRNGQSRAGQPDQIDVRVIHHADGSTAYLVDVPGTKVWDKPFDDSDKLNDLKTNVHVLGGETTAREQAIGQALRHAGAGPDDPVMLVGHSQGGMVAAQAAVDSGNGKFPYHVTHVLTAGSPVAHYAIPGNVQVLSLENRYDIVPHLDGAANPDTPNRTTVTFGTQNGTIGLDHGTDTAYGPAAAALDSSNNPSVTAYKAGAGQFLGPPGSGTTVTTKVYDLTRKPS